MGVRCLLAGLQGEYVHYWTVDSSVCYILSTVFVIFHVVSQVISVLSILNLIWFY